jgi:hypothetical protein
VDAVAHTVWLVIAATVGVGFTVMVKLCGVPLHVAAAGVTTIVAVAVTEDVLVAVKAAILPVPVEARPIEVLLFIQV